MLVLLPIHIVAAGLGIAAGAVALSSSKGGTLHRRSGIVFVYAMVGMCGTAAVMAAVKGQIVNVMAGSLTAYLVVTALLTVRPPSASSRRLTIGSMLVALALGLTAVAFGFEALASVSGEKYGAPAFPLFMFGVVGLLGSVGDLRTIRSGGLRGARRLTRHLWRMCWALWIATASFFGVRTRVVRVFGEALATPAMRTLPVLLVFLAMLYWLWRVRVRRSVRGITLLNAAAPSSARA